MGFILATAAGARTLFGAAATALLPKGTAVQGCVYLWMCAGGVEKCEWSNGGPLGAKPVQWMGRVRAGAEELVVVRHLCARPGKKIYRKRWFV